MRAGPRGWGIAIGAASTLPSKALDVVLMKSDPLPTRSRPSGCPLSAHQGEPVLGFLLQHGGHPPSQALARCSICVAEPDDRRRGYDSAGVCRNECTGGLVKVHPAHAAAGVGGAPSMSAQPRAERIELPQK